MKSILATILMVMMSTSAFAVNSSSSWSEIFASRDAFVTSGYSYNGLALDNVCITSTTVRSIHPVQECVRLVPVKVGHTNSEPGGRTDWVCEQWTTVNKVGPRTYSKRVCEQFDSNHNRYPECKSYGTESVTIPSTVWAQVTIMSGEAGTSFFKNYTFPECSEYPQPR